MKAEQRYDLAFEGSPVDDDPWESTDWMPYGFTYEEWFWWSFQGIADQARKDGYR